MKNIPIFLNSFTEELILNSLSEENKQKLKEAQLNKQLEGYEEDEVSEELTEQDKELNLGKITSLILNKDVLSIECIGPDKYIIINKFGESLPIHMTLTKEEIKEIITGFEKLSKTRKTHGVLKTTINNLLITAIDSEFAGPRFIITKLTSEQSRFL